MAFFHHLISESVIIYGGGVKIKDEWQLDDLKAEFSAEHRVSVRISVAAHRTRAFLETCKPF